MIGGERAEPGGERGALQVGELLRMQLDRQALRAGGFKHTAGLRRGEPNPLAEGVDGVGQTLGGDGRDHLEADEVDVTIGVARELGRQSVGAKEGRDDADVPQLAQAARGAKRLQFMLKREAVAGLDLDGGDALGDQGVEAGQGLGDKLVFGGCARGGHGGNDATPGAGNLFVARALQPQFELMGAVAAVDQVGVGIDQARGDPAALAIDGVGSVELGGLGLWAGVEDPAVLGDNDAVIDFAEPRPIQHERRETGIAPKAIAAHEILPQALPVPIVAALRFLV